MMTATVSHEMMTPLNSIINLSQYVLSKLQAWFKSTTGGSGTSQNKKHCQMSMTQVTDTCLQLSIIFNSATHLQYLVNGLLDVMKLKNGNLKLNDEKFDLEVASQEVVSLFEIQANGKGLDLTV